MNFNFLYYGDYMSFKEAIFKRFNYKKRNSFIKISIEKISNNTTVYSNMDISNGLDEFFINKSSCIEYLNIDRKLNQVPEGILIIPFLCNVLPVSWMLDSIIIIDELDKTFYESIEIIKSKYSRLYPKCNFNGNLVVKNIVDYEMDNKENYLSFFSLGVDSTSTVISHIDKNLTLVNIWGSDIPLEEENGWKYISKKITDFSNEFDLDILFIKSDFRKLLNTGNLSKKFSEILEDNWWHGLQHGMSIISHAIPYAYLYGINNILIASTYSKSESKLVGMDEIPCASCPSVDNEIKFAKNGIVSHDGVENSRQDKIEIITNFCDNNNKKDFLHVCWEKTDGKNCNLCEKCSRTIMGILSEKKDPNSYGFNVTDKTFENIKENINLFSKNKVTNVLWISIQKKFLEDIEYWNNDKNINWFLYVDLSFK